MRDKVVNFLQLSGIDKYPDMIAAGLSDQIRDQFGFEDPLPEQFHNAVELMKGALENKKSELFDTVVEIYTKTFSETEVDELVFFFSSEVGRRLVGLGGIVLPEVITAGNTWSVNTLKSVEGDLSKILA